MTALVALNRARAAWDARQPQLTIDGWADMMDGLDGAHAPSRELTALRSVEPVSPSTPPYGAGSTQSTSPGRMSSRDTRGRGQRR